MNWGILFLDTVLTKNKETSSLRMHNIEVWKLFNNQINYQQINLKKITIESNFFWTHMITDNVTISTQQNEL